MSGFDREPMDTGRHPSDGDMKASCTGCGEPQRAAVRQPALEPEPTQSSGAPLSAAEPLPSAPAPAPLPPRPSDQPVSVGAQAFRYLLAALGAFAAVIVAQGVFSIVGAVVLAVFAVILDPSGDADAIASGIIGPTMLASQLGCLAVFLPWWLHLRPVSFIRERCGAMVRGPRAVALRVVAIALLGIGFQLVIGYALSYLLPLVPDLQSEYSEIMNDGVTNEFSMLSVLILAVGAPVTEELACRGVVFEFALRAMCPEWAARWRDRSWRAYTGTPMPKMPPLASRGFWAANLIQAALFGILHLNIVQGLYAFALGVVLGWIAWRTGALVYSIGLHLAVNFSSYFVYELSTLFEVGGVAFAVLASVSMVVIGIQLFQLASHPDAAKCQM